jgi:hypothetical protein
MESTRTHDRHTDVRHDRPFAETPGLEEVPFQGKQAAYEEQARAERNERIRRRAYEIYEARGGRPGDGQDINDWVAAKNELGY